jgi:sulfite reductase (NADPH) flavoprotein alpha-component
VIETFRNLVPRNGVSTSPVPAIAAVEETGYDKALPFSAAVLERINLNGLGSGKKTYHLEISLTGSGITYQPGDALGIVPRNSPAYVEELVAMARLAPEASVSVDGKERPLAEALGDTFEITTITRPFVKAYASQAGHAELGALLEKGKEEDFQKYVHGREIIDVLQAFPPGDVQPQTFLGMLRRLQPRLYSIASSLLAHEEEVHLLVGLTRYESYGRVREGVCSSYVCERLGDDEPVRVYPSPNPTFKLPENPDARVIMIGPGTGVAPFRAFVEERETLGCRGRNWLFFGDQHFATDFLYQIEWQRWHKSGVLSHLDLAFSRDQAEKIYVQHRMIERGRDLYAWLQEGAHVYVCGEAGKMAADVHEALISIVEKESGKGREAAVEYVETLQANKRYQRDVY